MSDEDGIRRALALNGQLIDSFSFDEWAALYAEDGIHEAGGQRCEGRAEIRAFIERTLPDTTAKKKHIIGLPVIHVTGDTATAATDWLAFVVDDDGVTSTGMGRYHDEFVRSGNDWLFAHRRNERLL